MFSRTPEKELAVVLRAAVARHKELTAREVKRLSDGAVPIFGTVENLEVFRAALEELFFWDVVPLNGEWDRFDLYTPDIMVGLIKAEATSEMLPWLPFLSATQIAYQEGAGDFYKPATWLVVRDHILAVPVEYLKRALNGSQDEVMPLTLETLAYCYHEGLTAEYFRELPIRGKLLPDLGYTVEDAKRLQEADVPVNICSTAFYRKKAVGEELDETVDAALMLAAAGVPWLYMYQLFEAGLEPGEVVAAHKADLPIEYAIAASGSAA